MEQRVDILLCDIEMPRGSGIELMEWIRNQGYEPVCIFLTSYSSFNYASSAVRLQMFDYVLKPCEYSKLTEIIRKAVTKATESYDKREKEIRGKYWDDDYYNRLSNFWDRLLQGYISAIDSLIHRELEFRHLDTSLLRDQYYLFLLQVIPHGKMQDWQDNSWSYAIHNVIAELFHNPPVLIWDTAFIVILPSGSYIDLDDFGKACINLVNTLGTIIPANFQGYYAPKCSMQEANQRIRALKKDSHERFSPQNAIFQLGKRYTPRATPSFSDERWQDALLTNHPNVISDDIKCFLAAPAPYQYIDRQLLYSIYHQLLKVIYRVLDRHDLSAQQDFLVQSNKAENDICCSIHSFYQWVQETSEKTVQLISEKKLSASVMDTLTQYIRSNLNSELNRMELTKVVHLHPDYLSAMFRKNMGVSLLEYITRERIREAKSLLLSTDMPISEIAIRTGFQTISYFSKQFKKHENMTPYQYRKRIR